MKERWEREILEERVTALKKERKPVEKKGNGLKRELQMIGKWFKSRLSSIRYLVD